MTSDSPFPIPHSRPIQVVAGVITDARGRILLARRTEGRDLAGLWEFPGGKVDAGETPEQALRRELHEELGIHVELGEPLIAVPQQYPAKRLRLDVRRIAGWRGTVKGLDGQALAWVPPGKLPAYPMPPADRPVVAALLQPDRYLVTPSPGDDDAAWLAMLQRAVDAGARRVQLRVPGLDPARWHALAAEAIRRCRKARVEVLVNGDIALAARFGVGVHLRATHLQMLEARPLPATSPVAASCHTVDELRHAQRIGCDFAVLGPIHATSTHPAVAGIGWDAFALLREHVSLPIYAIGGLASSDIPTARGHGAQGIAAIRSLWPAA